MFKDKLKMALKSYEGKELTSIDKKILKGFYIWCAVRKKKRKRTFQQVSVDEAELRLKRMTIKSPIDGVVMARADVMDPNCANSSRKRSSSMSSERFLMYKLTPR